MRNLFDQYKEPENRLTHALACCLAEDPGLLRRFLRWASPTLQPPAKARLEVLEQRIPGEAVVDLDDDAGRGLPDMWIHDNDSWSLLVESKVKSPIKPDQLKRHLSTARRHDFPHVSLLVLAPSLGRHTPLPGVEYRTWEDVYTWFSRHRRRSPWAEKLIEYMQIAESRMTAEGYLTMGNLTTFDGIHFDTENPYTYREAKRLLKLMMEELRKHEGLMKLGMDPSGKGRSAITGSDRRVIWDLIPLRVARGHDFIEFPHLTLALHQDELEVIVTLPHRARTSCRRNLLGLGPQGFETLVQKVAKNLLSATQAVPGAKPMINALQRHYPSQRAAGIVDARLMADLRTTFPEGRDRVKAQPLWIRAIYDVLENRKGINFQVGIGALVPYGGDVVRSKAVVDVIADTWIACKEWLDVLLDPGNS